MGSASIKHAFFLSQPAPSRNSPRIHTPSCREYHKTLFTGFIPFGWSKIPGLFQVCIAFIRFWYTEKLRFILLLNKQIPTILQQFLHSITVFNTYMMLMRNHVNCDWFYLSKCRLPKVNFRTPCYKHADKTSNLWMCRNIAIVHCRHDKFPRQRVHRHIILPGSGLQYGSEEAGGKCEARHPEYDWLMRGRGPLIKLFYTQYQVSGPGR